MNSEDTHAGIQSGITLVYFGLLISIVVVVVSVTLPVVSQFFEIPVGRNYFFLPLRIALAVGLLTSFLGKIKCASATPEIGKLPIYMAVGFHATAFLTFVIGLVGLIPDLAGIGWLRSDWLSSSAGILVILGVGCFLWFLGKLAEHLWSDCLVQETHGVFTAMVWLGVAIVVFGIMFQMIGGLRGGDSSLASIWLERFAIPWGVLFVLGLCISVVGRYARLLSRFRIQLADKL